MGTIKRKVVVVFDLEYIPKSVVFGDITEKRLKGNIEGVLSQMFVGQDIHEAEGDFYSLENPKVILHESELLGLDIEKQEVCDDEAIDE